MGIKEGFGREDDKIQSRFPGMDAHVARLTEAGVMPDRIASHLNDIYRVRVFSSRWVESILRRVSK